MSAGLSVPDGAGLGTLGFHETKAREMTEAAGFSQFRTVPLATYSTRSMKFDLSQCTDTETRRH
jgi:hypothetical protein